MIASRFTSCLYFKSVDQSIHLSLQDPIADLRHDWWQIVDPTNTYIVHNAGVSSGDYSFDAKNDGKHVYCFSNENWSASTKEVSFNVHGIVYVPESEAPADPLEKEGMSAPTHLLLIRGRTTLYDHHHSKSKDLAES